MAQKKAPLWRLFPSEYARSLATAPFMTGTVGHRLEVNKPEVCGWQPFGLPALQ
jgi:hypothetical protein